MRFLQANTNVVEKVVIINYPIKQTLFHLIFQYNLCQP